MNDVGEMIFIQMNQKESTPTPRRCCVLSRLKKSAHFSVFIMLKSIFAIEEAKKPAEIEHRTTRLYQQNR